QRPRSTFISALVAQILMNESNDPSFSFTLQSLPDSDSQSTNPTVAVWAKTKAGHGIAAQFWTFDNKSGLPVAVEFILPARIGDKESYPGTVMFSDYRSVGGVLYPFKIVTVLPRRDRIQTLTVQSVTPSASTSAAPSSTGGAQ